MLKNALYGGVNAAVLTAMRPDLSVDLDRMAAHCRWLLANGCNGLAILGTTGEANSLGVSERVDLMEGLVARGLQATTLMPGVGTPALTDTVLLAKKAAALGCPGVLVLPPFFYKNPTEDGLFAYFSEVIQRMGDGTKLYLYHFPAQSAVPFTIPFINRLLKAYPRTVAGIKDSSGDFANSKGYIDHFAKDGFEVYAGDDSTLYDLLNAGGAGCITAASNVGCAVNAKVLANWDNDTGRQAQVTLTAIRKAVISVPMIPGLKALVARRTGEEGWNAIRPPHLTLTAEQKAISFANFDACGAPMAQAA
jgi:4-hydroxy-tetrahydrodipicolinate synthase